jgi:hypothetical protein
MFSIWYGIGLVICIWWVKSENVIKFKHVGNSLWVALFGPLLLIPIFIAKLIMLNEELDITGHLKKLGETEIWHRKNFKNHGKENRPY